MFPSVKRGSYLNFSFQIARLLRSSKHQGRVIGHPAWSVDTFVVCTVAPEVAATVGVADNVSHRHEGATVHSLVERIEHHQQDLRQARGVAFPWPSRARASIIMLSV